MKVRSTFTRYAASLLLCVSASSVYARSAPVGDDTPANASLVGRQEGKAKASMESMQIPSHGSLVNGLVYVAAGAEPHPVVILLHGFPGNERNLDLAQDMRRAGWDVMYFNYRGSWGSPGDFSFSHGIEDVASAIAYVREPENARRLRLDPSRIVLVGHSMGGFMTVQAASADPAIKAIAMISAADFGDRFMQMQKQGSRADALKKMSAGLAGEGMAPLSGCTPDSLANEVASHATAWALSSMVGALKDRPAFVITSDDGLAPSNDAFVAALRRAGDTQVKTLHLPTDHAYSDQREALSQALLQWLSGLK
jgi:pimeloyl-ACP methyl ester carboxylesterase